MYFNFWLTNLYNIFEKKKTISGRLICTNKFIIRLMVNKVENQPIMHQLKTGYVKTKFQPKIPMFQRYARVHPKQQQAVAANKTKHGPAFACMRNL